MINRYGANVSLVEIMRQFPRNLSLSSERNFTLYKRSAFNKFPDFFVEAFKIVVDSGKSVCYCYTSREVTDQFVRFQVQMNSYSSN